jgi:hypothetical protein
MASPFSNQSILGVEPDEVNTGASYLAYSAAILNMM